MRLTKIACGIRDDLYAVEAEHDAQLERARSLLTSLVAAKKNAGVNGTIGDADIARAQDYVNTLEAAQLDLQHTHEELYAVLPGLAFPNVAINPKLEAMDQSVRTA